MSSEIEYQQTEIGEIPVDWSVSQINKFFNVKNGKRNSQDALDNGEYPLFDRSSLVKRSNQFLFNSEAIILPGEGKEFIAKYYKGKFDLHQRAYAITPKTSSVSTIFYYYWFLFYKNHLSQIAVGSTVKSLRLNHLTNFPIPELKFSEQSKVAKILFDLDKKIGMLSEQNSLLEKFTHLIFKRWFVDFEFPNMEGNPYKSFNGEMIESELGEIPKGWSIKRLGELIINFDSKRVPLSSMQRKDRIGKFPYYGATKIMDYIDDYLFDGIYLLLAEDGSVTTNDGFPVLQYVEGKFWVSNHAHVIQGKQCSTEFIYLLLSKRNIEPYVTGAVQPKLNQANLNSIEIIFPSEEILAKCEKLMKNIFLRRISIEKEINRLNELRDILLPQLMTGKIRVKLDE